MTMQFYGWLLARKFICFFTQSQDQGMAGEIALEWVGQWIRTGFGTTFYWMPEDGCSPLGLCLQSSLLMELPLDLLDAQMVLVDGDTQDYLGAILIDDELIQMLAQDLGGDVAGAYIACAA